MFTGLVEEMGTIVSVHVDAKSGQTILTIKGDIVLQGVELGDSIATNGVCLTVTTFDHATKTYTVGLSPETLRRTNLGHLKTGSPVNLERSVAANGRMGGHFVQGHVDGTGKLVSLTKEDDSLWVKVGCSDELIKYIVEKGYITIDGTSLTVCDVNEEEGWFTIMLIQYTQGKVIIPLKQPGELVNLEVDIVGKYVARYMEKWDKAKARRSKL